MKLKKLVYTILPIAAFFLITLAFFRKAVFSDYVYINLSGDSYFCFYSWSYYFLDCVKSGIFPLWNSLSLCGHPFGTEAPSNFNVLNFLVLIVEPKTAWNIRLMCCMFFSGYFAYLYAKQIGISRYSSFICGLVYMFSTSVLDSHLHTVTLFVPAMLLCVDKAVLIKNFLWLILSAMLMMLYYLNSNPQFVFYVFIFMNIYIIFRYSMIYKNENPIQSKRLWRMIVTFALLVFGFSSFHLFRTMEITRICQRGVWYNQYFMLSPAHLLTLIFPYLYDSPFRQEYNFIFGRIWVEGFKHIPYWLGKAHVVSAASYLGVLPLILAIVAFTKRRKKSFESFFGWSAFILIIYVLTPFIWYLIIRYIPVVNMMFQIQRTYIIYDISVAVLAALGMEMFLKDRKPLYRITENISKICLLILSALLIAMSSIHIYAALNKSALLNIINIFVEKNIIGNSLFIAPAELYYARARQFYDLIYSWSDILAPSFLISAVIILASLIALRLYLKRIVAKNIFKAVVLLIILIDLFFIASVKINAFPRKDVTAGGDLINFLKQQPGIFRVIQIQDGDLSKPMDPTAILRPNSNLFYGLQSSEGYQSLIIGRYTEFMTIFEKGTNKDLAGLIGEFKDFDQNLADLMNIKYIVTSSQRRLEGAYKFLYQDKRYMVYENLDVLPRSFVVHDALVVRNNEEIRKKLSDSKFNFSKTVILEEDVKFDKTVKGVRAQQGECADIKLYQPHRVIVEADLKSDGYLILTDCFFPGWKVLVDGKADKIYKADYIYRAVALSKGSHKVEFKYDPFSFKIGLAITIAAFLITCFLIIFKHKKNYK